MFANTQMMGMSLHFPDVCQTPMPAPVPVPYPNIALGPTAVPTVFNVLMMGAPAHNMATMTPMTHGDEPGVALGVASGLVMGPQRHVTGAFTVLINGMPATRLTSVSLSNGTNAVGARIVPSQVNVVLLAP